MRLWLLRHAPVLAAPGLCYGRLDLAADGAVTLEAARRIAPRLPNDIGVSSSPLGRCTALANAVMALRPDLRLTLDPRLAEMDFGSWEGRPWSAVDRSRFDAWMADFADARAGGGDGAGRQGESVRIFMERVAGAWDDLRGRGRDALWVTHVGVVRAALLLHLGVPCPSEASVWPREGVACGDWLTLQIDMSSESAALVDAR